LTVILFLFQSRELQRKLYENFASPTSNKKMNISFIIPVKPDGYVKAIESIKSLAGKDFTWELLIASGSQPSRQRNIAAVKASGEILYFLDDDSMVCNSSIEACLEAMRDSMVTVIGGPSLTPSADSSLQRLFGAALGSLFGAGKSRSRYRPVGRLRETSEKELILCNLAIRRDIFLSSGGFDERLYPNEENELLDRLAMLGHKLIYNPRMIVERSQRASLWQFCRQFFRYGRGRGEQTRISKNLSFTKFIPLFFVTYLLLLPLFPTGTVFIKIPLFFYILTDALVAAKIAAKEKNILYFLLFLIFPLMHCSNGVGLLSGIIKGGSLEPESQEITVKCYGPETLSLPTRYNIDKEAA